jgi:hypothetical protein
MIMPEPNCYTCVHRRPLAGNTHSRCNKFEATVLADAHGVHMGWFRWPVNFDPAWLRGCDSYSTNAEDNIPGVREADPLTEILGLLG